MQSCACNTCWGRLEAMHLAVRTPQYGNTWITYFTRDEVTVERRKLHNEKLHNLYSLTNNVGTIRWRRRISETTQERYEKFALKNVTRRKQLTELDVEGRIILKLVKKKKRVRTWTGFSWLLKEANDGIIWKLEETNQFRKRREIYWPTERTLQF
jgi:hypothetical protein